MHQNGIVHLVGAGPGDPGLLTKKADLLLRTADTVVYDRLANPVLLTYARKDCELVFAGKSPHRHALHQNEINELLVKLAQEGKTVVRLKGGDPFVFGRGGEEARALKQAGVPFTIVPGITSAVAVPAYAGIPVTQRGMVTSFSVITGHGEDGEGMSADDWDDIAQRKGTLVFLMGIATLPQITAELIARGKPTETKTAVIMTGTRQTQKTVTAPLADIEKAVAEAGINPPAIIVIGEVVGMREEIAWREAMPLFGNRILLTRTEAKNAAPADSLSLLGAEVFSLPLIETIPLQDYAILDNAIASLESFDWLVFTSAKGVSYFKKRLLGAHLDARSLGKLKFATVGPATASALRSMLGMQPDLQPDDPTQEGLTAELLSALGAKSQVLFVRASKGRDLLIEQLSNAGHQVTLAPAYATQASVPDERLQTAFHEWAAGGLEWCVLTSPSAAKSLQRLIAETNTAQAFKDCRFCCIGPVTQKAAEAAGFKNCYASAKPDDASMISTIKNSSILT